MPGVQSFLNARRHTTNATDRNITHVSLIHPRGRFSMNTPDTDQFWRLYGAEYMDGIFGLAEMTGLHLPVLVDIDLKQEHHLPDGSGMGAVDANVVAVGQVDGGAPLPELYAPEFVSRLVGIYQKVLREILDNVPETHLMAVYMAKRPYLCRKGGRLFVKHGFHLHFPMIYLHRYIQENELLPRVRLELKRINTSLPVPPDQALDRTYCRGNTSPWLLYGSRKDEEMDPYLIDSIYDHEGRRVEEWRSHLLEYQLYPVAQETQTDARVVLTPENLDFHLPKIFGTHPEGRSPDYVVELREDLTPIQETLRGQAARQFVSKTDRSLNVSASGRPPMTLLSPTSPTSKSLVPSSTDDGAASELDVIRDLLEILDTERSIDRNEWIHVGWILYNILDGSDTGLDLWLHFSRKSPAHYDESSCRYEWTRMVKKNLTMGTLKHLAREDDPIQYRELMSRYARPFMDKAVDLNGTHHDIALALFHKYENEFVCGSIRDRLWYHFCAPVWVRTDEGTDLRARISGEIVKNYEAMSLEWLSQMRSDKEQNKFFQKKSDQIMKLVTKLKSSPFKTNIMKECTEVFYDAGFISQLDANPFLIAFQNGVYDLKEMMFRKGLPSDRMSMCMPISYREDLSMDHPDVQGVVGFLEQIFPDALLREYFLNISCEVFIGGNSNKIVQFWSGEGDNGKSVTQSLFEKMLGPYSIKLPTSLLVGKRTQSSSACPELARAGNGVRLAMLQEPDQTDVINIGILKELSGNDSFFARGLYKDGCEIQPMFKLVLVCNDPPKVPTNDRAAWNRIRVIPFESTFTDEPPETIEEQLAQKRFPKDKYFSKKIPKMAEAFAWYLLTHLRMRPAHRPEPEKVRLATSMYQRKNDVFRQFIDETVVDEPTSSVRLNDIYDQFKDWFRDSVPHGSIPNKSEFRDYLTKMWGDPRLGGGVRWEGRALLTAGGMLPESAAVSQLFD